MDIYLIDTLPCFAEGLRCVCASITGTRIVGIATDFQTGIVQTEKAKPDITIVDATMKGFDELILRHRPDVRFVVTGTLQGMEFAHHILECGARAYVLRSASPLSMRTALSEVLAGRRFVDPSIGTESPLLRDGQGGVHLSDREIEVLRRSAMGYSCKEIARALALSPKSVETYKARVLQKLHLESRVDIVRYASTLGWLGMPGIQHDGSTSGIGPIVP